MAAADAAEQYWILDAGEVMNSRRSLSYARRVRGLSMLANQATAGGTSANCWNWTGVRLPDGAGLGVARGSLDVN